MMKKPTHTSRLFFVGEGLLPPCPRGYALAPIGIVGADAHIRPPTEPLTCNNRLSENRKLDRAVRQSKRQTQKGLPFTWSY